MSTAYPVVVLDPSLLAIPNAANSSEDAELLLWRMTKWAGCLSRPSPLKIVQLRGTLELLADTNHFPAGPNITALLEMYDLKHVFSSEDLRRSINFILEHAPYCMDECGIEVETHSHFDCVPADAVTSNDPQLSHACERSAVTALCCEWVGTRDAPASVAGGLIPACGRTIQLRAQIDHLDSTAPLPELSFPVSIFGPVRFNLDDDEVITNIEPLKLWNSAESTEDIWFALGLSALASLRTDDSSARIEHIPRFSVGTEFFRSLQDNDVLGTGHASVVLNTCKRLVLSKPKEEIKPLLGRMGSKAKGKQQVSRLDGGLAYRTRIGKSHEALRLMFWRTEFGIELANIGPKNELEIHTGAAGKAAKLLF